MVRMDPARHPVWTSMANLFLDTDTRLHYAFIARVTAASPYSLEELEQIFLTEVAPVLEYNLLDIAGEWSMFDDDGVIASVESRLAGNPAPYEMQTDVVKCWRQVAHLVRCLRALPEAERLARSRLWDDLKMMFLDKSAKEAKGLDTVDPALLAHVLTKEMAPAYGWG
jgi:hypothetical protein